jgi:hypothetical protein
MRKVFFGLAVSLSISSICWASGAGAEASLDGTYFFDSMSSQCTGDRPIPFSPVVWSCRAPGAKYAQSITVTEGTPFEVQTMDDGSVRLTFEADYLTKPYICEFSADTTRRRNGAVISKIVEREHGCDLLHCNFVTKQKTRLSLTDKGLQVDFEERTRVAFLGFIPFRTHEKLFCTFPKLPSPSAK